MGFVSTLNVQTVSITVIVDGTELSLGDLAVSAPSPELLFELLEEEGLSAESVDELTHIILSKE